MSFFCILKIINPCSYLSGMKVSADFLGDPLQDTTIDDIYRCLQYVQKLKDPLLKYINRIIDISK